MYIINTYTYQIKYASLTTEVDLPFKIEMLGKVPYLSLCYKEAFFQSVSGNQGIIRILPPMMKFMFALWTTYCITQ